VVFLWVKGIHWQVLVLSNLYKVITDIEVCSLRAMYTILNLVLACICVSVKVYQEFIHIVP
jgi:hypothetical protein